MTDHFIIVEQSGPQGPAGDPAGDLGLFDVTSYGAVGNGVINDTTAIQQAIDAASTASGGTVYFPPGTYKCNTALVLKNHVSLLGANREDCFIDGSLDAVTWTTNIEHVKISGLSIYAGTGHVLTGTGYMARSEIYDCNLVVQANGKSIIYMNDEMFIGNVIQRCNLTRPAGATVPGVYLVDSTAGSNVNIFRDLWVYSNNSTAAAAFYLESTASANYIYDNTFENIVDEQSRGGVIEAYSVNGLYIKNVHTWDATGNYMRDIIKVGQSATGGSLDSRNVSIENYARRGGSLQGGVFDINLVPNEVLLARVIGCGHTITPPTMNLATGTVQMSNGATATIVDDLTVSDDLTVTGDSVFTASATLNGVALRPAPVDSESMTTGQIVPHRRDWNNSSISMTVAGSGDLFLSFFTADKTESINTVTTYTGATAAAATPTLCRVGIYSVAANGDLTLINSSANDTAMWAATNTAYPKALSSTFNKVAGERYAVAAICVNAGTRPSLHGKQGPATAVFNTLSKELPEASGVVTGQTDLLTPITFANAAHFGFQAALGFKLS